MTDPIADMLTRIRNAVTAKHTRVDLPASRIKADIARVGKLIRDAGIKPAEVERACAALGGAWERDIP